MYNGFRILNKLKPYKQFTTSRFLKINNICNRKTYCSDINSKYQIQDLRYSSVFLKVLNKDQTADEFTETLSGLLQTWKKLAKRSVLIEIPISQSHLIKEAAKYGFQYHHARNETAVLSSWLVENTENKIPLFANHTVGVAGACYNREKDELLLVKDKGRYQKWWKFPGGFSDIGEQIDETAVREVYEETGVQSKFMSLLTFREQHDNSFGQSDLYFICRMHPLTYDLTPCPDEIDSCAWMSTDEILSMSDTTPFVKVITQLLVDSQDDFDRIDINATVLENFILKGKKNVLYHNNILPTK